MTKTFLPSDTTLIAVAHTDALRPIVSWSTGAFIEEARKQGVTPETLCLIAQQYYLQKKPDLNLISDRELSDRDCATCALQELCGSARREKRDVCFL